MPLLSTAAPKSCLPYSLPLSKVHVLYIEYVSSYVVWPTGYELLELPARVPLKGNMVTLYEYLAIHLVAFCLSVPLSGALVSSN